MENIILLLGIGAVVVFLILQFDKQQRKRVKKVLVHTEKVEPLFLKQAAEQKLLRLKKELIEFENAVAHTDIAEKGMIAHNKLAVQLDEAVTAYSSQKIALNSYCSKLDHLLGLVKRYQKEAESLTV